ncbi:MAG: DUF805 domain-containing protein [Muribaculaceae bacterium]
MTYFIMYQCRPIGPLNIDQVFGYTRDAATPVSRDGGPWYPLSSYPELAERLARLMPPPPAAEPVQRTVSFGEAIARGFRGYVTFKGRASRSEFWFWFLLYAIISIPLMSWMMSTEEYQVSVRLLQEMMAGSLPADVGIMEISRLNNVSQYVSGAVSLVFFLPNLAVSMRRLHDSGHSGWWMLLIVPLFSVCYIGYIIMLIFGLQPSEPRANQYGPVPNQE